MTYVTINDVYAEYKRLYFETSSEPEPERTRDEIMAAAQATGQRFEDIDSETFWDVVGDGWLVGIPGEQPFPHDSAYRAEYERLAALRGIAV